jgi:hypothetical protein|tara:strand:- start:236 stop:481 length:246 start_codon:yes stop_codon:yes gene_type:complete
MTDVMNEWEKRNLEAKETWANMTEHQRDQILTMLKAWVPVRSRVSELCPITYDDIRALDDAWWGLKNALVDRDVEIREWDL